MKAMSIALYNCLLHNILRILEKEQNLSSLFIISHFSEKLFLIDLNYKSLKLRKLVKPPFELLGNIPLNTQCTFRIAP